MLTSYIQAAMHRAIYKLLEDKTFFGEIPELKGLWTNAETLEACRDELQERLEEWIALGLLMGHTLPVLDEVDLNFTKEEVA